MREKRLDLLHLQPGFTFMEIMIVVVILGLLMGIGVPAYLRFAETAKENATKSQLLNLKTSISTYYLQLGRYPSRLEDLIERPKGEIGKKWKGPYLEKEKIPLDGWNHELHYKPTSGEKHPYELYSYGGPGGPDEPAERRISVWDI